MGLRILHSADWHLDSPFAGFTEVQRRGLRAEQRKLPGKIVDLCRRENCDLLLLAGDLFDGVPSRETLDCVRTALKNSGIPVLIAPGNHDFVTGDSVWETEQWPENVFVFTGGLESVTISGLDCRIYGAAFQSMDCVSLLEGFQAEGEERYCIALLHGDATNRNSAYNAVTASQVKQSGLDYLALGHIHKAGAFRAGSTLCAWPGCPMGRGWDETGEKGVCIVTLGQEAQIQAVSLDTLRFYDLEVDVEDGIIQALENSLPGQGSSDYYRVTLVGSGEVDMTQLQVHFGTFPNLEFRDHTQPPMDIWETADADSLEGVYFGMLKRAMEEDPDNAQKIRLAAEISRKLLSGREITL